MQAAPVLDGTNGDMVLGNYVSVFGFNLKEIVNYLITDYLVDSIGDRIEINRDWKVLV